ncbi:hypothetical protein KRR40_41745 [Niabella defluvii]|nr:hypothetical protein KRR40_41745 [Niabella sp. I65]
MHGYLDLVHHRLSQYHTTVINAGLVDNVDKAFEAGSLFRKEAVDLIFLYVTTYALSATVLPVVQKARVPVIILNLSPEAAINYQRFNAINDRVGMTGSGWLIVQPARYPKLPMYFSGQVSGFTR